MAYINPFNLGDINFISNMHDSTVVKLISVITIGLYYYH